ncbi:MAG: hypothetical protein [aquatic viral metagenome]
MHIYGTLDIHGLTPRVREFKGTSLDIRFQRPTTMQYTIRWRSKAIAYSHFNELFNVVGIEEQLYKDVEKASNIAPISEFSNIIQNYIRRLHEGKKYIIISPNILTYYDDDGVARVYVADGHIVNGQYISTTQYERGVLLALSWLHYSIWDNIATLLHEILALKGKDTSTIDILFTTMRNQVAGEATHASDIKTKQEKLYIISVIDYMQRKLKTIIDETKNIQLTSDSAWLDTLSRIRTKVGEYARKAIKKANTNQTDIEWYSTKTVSEYIDTNGTRITLVNLGDYDQTDLDKYAFYLGPSLESIYGSILNAAVRNAEIPKELKSFTYQLIDMIATLTLNSRDCNISIKTTIEEIPSRKGEEVLERVAQILTMIIDIANTIASIARMENMRTVVYTNVVYTNIRKDMRLTKGMVGHIIYPLSMTINGRDRYKLAYSLPAIIGLTKHGTIESVLSSEINMVLTKPLNSVQEIAVPVEIHEIPGIISIDSRGTSLTTSMSEFIREYTVITTDGVEQLLIKARETVENIYKSYRTRSDIDNLINLVNTYLQYARIVAEQAEGSGPGNVRIQGETLVGALALGIIQNDRYLVDSDKVLGVLTLNVIKRRLEKAGIVKQITTYNSNEMAPVAVYNENEDKIYVNRTRIPIEKINIIKELKDNVPKLPEVTRDELLQVLVYDITEEELNQVLTQLNIDTNTILDKIVKNAKFIIDTNAGPRLTLKLLPIRQQLTEYLTRIRSGENYTIALTSITNDLMSAVALQGEMEVKGVEQFKIRALYTDGRGSSAGQQMRYDLRIAPVLVYTIGAAKQLNNIAIRVTMTQLAGILLDKDLVDLGEMSYQVVSIEPPYETIVNSLIDTKRFPQATCIVVTSTGGTMKPNEITDFRASMVTVGHTNKVSAEPNTQNKPQENNQTKPNQEATVETNNNNNNNGTQATSS